MVSPAVLLLAADKFVALQTHRHHVVGSLCCGVLPARATGGRLTRGTPTLPSASFFLDRERISRHRLKGLLLRALRLAGRNTLACSAGTPAYAGDLRMHCAGGLCGGCRGGFWRGRPPVCLWVRHPPPHGMPVLSAKPGGVLPFVLRLICDPLVSHILPAAAASPSVRTHS